MCGIAGVYYRNEKCSPENLIAMRDTLVHRGPDDAGEFIQGPLGLGHRRLSIIDLAGGHQPMHTADGRMVIVFNGEIYNYRELRQELEMHDHTFATNSDTEVILRLHEYFGDDAVGRLNGIFAYAIWDTTTNRLLLARDRMGIKPLYVSSNDRGFAFASEIKALLRSDLVNGKLNERHLAEYLIFRQVAGEENLFADIKALAPGHTLEIVDGKPSNPKQYWSASEPKALFTGSYEDAVNALDAALNRAVSRQLMSEVPLGTFCSGGIDSSLTTAIAAQHTSHPINTFSVGFDDSAFDESAYARSVARACGTKHHELRLSEQEFAELLPELIWHHDLPLNFANSVHIYAISRLARESVTVVLTGEGADELFGGYPRYYIPRLLQIAARVPAAIRKPLFALLAHAPDHRMRKLAHVGQQSLRSSLLFNSTATDHNLALSALNQTEPLSLAVREACIDNAAREGSDILSTVSLLDLQTYLVSILNRQDKMSMATSLEARVPFLDNEIVDLAQSLPVHFKQTFRHRKRVLKSVAARYLPAEIINRRKSGFGVPLQNWFAGSGPMSGLLDETLNSDAITSLFDNALLSRLVAEHRSGGKDHSEFLWSVLNLGLWRRAFAV